MMYIHSGNQEEIFPIIANSSVATAIFIDTDIY